MRNCLPGRRHRMVKDTSQESVPKLHLGNGQKTTQPHCREARHSRGRSQQRKQFTMPWEHLIALWMSGNRVWSYPMHLQRSVCISTWITDHRQPHPRGNYSSTDVSRPTSCPWTYSNASLILKKKKSGWAVKDSVPHLCVFFFLSQNWQQEAEKWRRKPLCTGHLPYSNRWHAAAAASSDHHKRHQDFFILLWDPEVQQACSVAGLRDRRFGANIGTQLFFFFL